jgi:Protein of unknown function (DUF4435)
MNKKSKPITPLSEIIAEIKKPARMKHHACCVLVEGVDDVIIYEEIARKCGLATDVYFEQRGGRTQLFKDHLAIIEQEPILLNKMLFLADKDMFVFEQHIPIQYKAINFTNGYSIENDLFQDGHELVLGELSPAEKERFKNLLESIIAWYAFEVELLQTTPSDVKMDIRWKNPNIIAPHAHSLESSFLNNRNYQPANQTLVERIAENYIKLLRGKILFEVLLRISEDREDKNFRIFGPHTYWNLCITQGKANINSNTNRIVSLFNNWKNTQS